MVREKWNIGFRYRLKGFFGIIMSVGLWSESPNRNGQLNPQWVGWKDGNFLQMWIQIQELYLLKIMIKLLDH